MKMTRSVSLCALAALIMLLLAACAGAPEVSGDADNVSDDPTKGWKALSYEGASIVYPPEWEAMEVPGGKIVSAPGNAAYIHMRLVPGEGPRIAQTDGEAFKQQYEASLTYEEPNIETFEKKEIGGEEAIIAVLTATVDEIGSDPVTELIYYALVRRGDNAVMVMCTCKEKVRAEFEGAFKQAVDSITAG